MSYLKTFQKFADRPLRPGLEEEEVLVSEDAPPETAPGAPQADGVPSLDTQVQTIASDLFPDKPEKLDLPDPFNIQETPNVFKETFGSPEARKQLALEVASNAGSEVFKGYDKLMSATAPTLGDLPGNIYAAQEATAEVLPYLTNEPVSDEARKVLEGTRAVKEVMTIDDVVTNAVSSRLEKRFIDAAQDKKQGRNAYRSFLDSYLVQAEGNIRETLGKEEGELTRRDAERTLARYVDTELKSPSDRDAGTPLFILARRAAEDANQLATTSGERRILGGTATTLIDAIRERDPGLALREAGLLEATPEDERKLSFRERFFDAPGAFLRSGLLGQTAGPTIAAEQRLDEVRSTLSQRVEAEDIAAEGQKAPVGTLLGADILRLAIKNRDVTFDFDPEFKAFQGPSREDVEAQFYSKAVSDEQQQRRLLENSRRTGVPVEILYGISRKESANQPTAFAYNLHIDAENRTAEQNEKILTVLREIGLDPETKKRTKGKENERPTSYYGNDARKVFSVVFSENPASAVRGGAWGQFQILGQRGSGNFVDMMREIAKRDRGEDITEDEAAAFAVSAFKSQPTLISDMLLSRWFNNNKVAVDAAKNQDIQKLAEKYFGSAVSDVEQTRRKNWVQKVTENRDAYIEQMARSSAAIQAQTERNKAANTETFAPGAAPADAEDRDFVNVLGSGPTFTKGRETDPGDAVSDAIGFDLVRVEGGLVEQTSAFADLKEYPTKGGQNWVDSTDQFRVDEKESPLMAQMDIAKSLPPSDSFAYFSEYYVAPALREAERVAEREGRELNENERRKVVSDARKKAFVSASSAQTAQYWRQPFYVSAEFLEALDVGEELPGEMPTNLLGGASLFNATFTPQIEVLGRTSRNGIAYRSETPTIVTLNALDALPYYGMSFNMGFVGTPLKRLGQDVYNGRASLNSLRAAVGLSPSEYAEYTNDPAASLGKLEILGAARNLWNNGVRGVQSRQNPVEALAFAAGEVGSMFAGTTVGRAVMEEVLEQGFLPKRLNSLSDDARRIALVDSARAYGTLVGILPGFIIAMKSPDGINALIESSRVAGRASRTFRALATVKGLADYIEPMGNINYARLVYKVGLSRSENVETLRAALLTLGEAEASGDVTSTLVLSALGRLEDTIPEFRLSDRVDATLRKDYPGSSKELDAMLEARLGMKSGQDDVLGEFNGAKNASDTKLAQTVYERMLKLVDQYETAADPVKREAAERLRVLLTTGAEYEDAKGKKQFIKIDKTVGLSPGTRDAVLRADGAESAATVFDTATQLEALYLGLRLAEPVSDAEDLRLSVFLGGMANPIQSLYGAGAKVLRGEKFDTSTGLAGALEFYKPVEKKAFEASLEASNLTDDAKNLQRQKFDQLTEFHTSFLEAVNNGTILDPQIVDSLRRQFVDTKLFEAPPIMFSGAEVPPGLRNQRYRSVVDRVFEVAGSTQSASTDANLFQRSLSGLMETAEQRGQLLRDLAMKPYDGRLLPESMGATPTERLLTFLSPDGGHHRLDRAKAAVRAGFGEARLALRSYSPLSAPKLRLRLQRKGLSPEEIQRVMAYRTDVDLLMKEQLIQDLADGRDDITVAKMIRTTVENQLAARLAAVDENSGVAEALRKELEMVRGDDWNRNLLTWIRETTTEVNNAVKENRAPQTVPLRLPTAVNPIAIGLPETNIAPLPATQSFFKRLYADAFSKMPPTEVAEPLSTKSRTVARKLQRAERYAEQVILDQMFRAMAGVTAETDMLKANDAVEKMLSDTILNIRAVRSKKERALRYNAVRSRFVFAVAQDLQNTAANNADKEFFNRFLAPHLLPVANQPLRVVEEKKLFDALIEDINEKTSGTQRARLLQALNASSARAIEVVLDTMDPDEAMLLFESTDDTLRAAIAAGEGAFEARRLFQGDGAATAGARSAEEIEEARRLWEEQGVESPYFKRWSEGLPVAKSLQEVGEGGAVVKLYHGTASEFDAFRGTSETGRLGDGVYLTDNLGRARTYAKTRLRTAQLDDAKPKVLELFAVTRRPLNLQTVPVEVLRRAIELLDDPEFLTTLRQRDSSTRLTDDHVAAAKRDLSNRLGTRSGLGLRGRMTQMRSLRQAAEDLGYDSIINLPLEILFFNPEQVKSVVNRGTFDPGDARILFQKDDAPLRRRRVAKAAPTAEEGLPVEDIKRLAKSLARKERQRLNAKSGVRSRRDLSVVDRENGALKRSLSTASAQVSRAQDAEAAGQNPRRVAMLRKKAQDAVRAVLVDAVEEAAKTALPDAIVDMAAIFKADEAALNTLIESPDRIQVLAAAIEMASTPDKITPESITPFFKLLGELGLQDKVDVRRLMTYTGQPPKVKAAKAEEVEAVAEVPEVAEAVEAAPKVPEVEPVDVAPIERAIEEVAPEPVPAARAEPEVAPEVVPEVVPEAAPEVVRPEVVTEDQPQRAPDFLSPAQVERREALLDREPLLPPEPIFSDADELAAQLEMLRSELPISDLKIRAVPFQSDEESPVYGRGKFVVNPEGDLLQFDNFNQLEEARPYVVLEIDGVRVPFYQSTGTGGKLNQTGVWYPIFGVAPGGWLVKGKESDIADYYGSRKLAVAADFLDAMLGNVRPLLKDLKGKVTTTPFPRLPDTHQEFLNAGRVAPAYDATADVRNNAINSVLAELGEPPRYRSVAGEEVTGRFGTGLSPDKPEVVEVYPDTAATAAGVQKGDVILAMNGDEVKSTTDVMRKLIRSRPDDEVAVTVLRNGEKKRLNVTLGRKTTEEAPAFDEVAEVPEPQRQAEVQEVVRETPEVIVETIPVRKAARKDATKKSAATFAKLPKSRKSETVPKAKRKKVSPEAPAPAPKAAKPAPQVTATKAAAEEIAPQVSDPVALREFVDSLAEKLEGDAQVLSTFVENFGEAGLLSSLKVIVDPDISDVVKYDFATNVVRVSDKAVETGTITQNMIGELWGALSRYISDESVAALRLDYARSQRRMRALADRDPTMAVFADMDFDSWVVQTMAAETLRQQRKDLTARRASEEAARNVAAQAKGRQPEVAPLASEASLSVFQALHSLVKSILRRLFGTSKVTAEEVYAEVLRTLSADEVPEPRAQSLSEYFDEVTKAAEAEVVAPKALDTAEEDVIAEIVEGASNHMVEKVVEPVVAKLPEVRATEDEVAETVAETTPVKTLKEEPVDVVEEVDVEAPIGGVAVRGDQVRITPATTSLDALTAEEKARKALELPGGPTAREQMAPKTISKKNWSIILREAVKSDLDRLLSVNIIDTLRSLGVTEADEEVVSAAWVRALIRPPVLTGKRAARKPRKPKARSLKIVNEDGVVVGFAPRVVTPLEMRQQREARKPAAAPTKEAPELSEAEAQQVTVRDPFEALEALSPIEASAFLEGIEMAVEQPVTIRQVLDSVTDLMPEGINQRTAVELIRFTLTGMARRGEIVQAIQPDGSLLLTPGKPTGVTPLSERFLARTKQVERQKKLTQDAKKVEKVAQKAEEVRAARIKADDVAVVDDTPLTARQEDTVRNRIARLEETATPTEVVPATPDAPVTPVVAALSEVTPDARARLIEILTELPRTTALPSGIEKSQRVQVAKTLLAALEFVAPYIRFPEGLEQLRGLNPTEPQVSILRAVQEGLIKKLDELVGDDVEAVVLNDADTADLVARAKASGQLADTEEAAQAVTQARKHASRLKNTAKKARGAELEAQLTDADVPEVETSPLAPSNINDLGEAVKALNLVAVSPGTRAAKKSAIAALRRIEEVLSGVRGEGARKGSPLFVAQNYGDNLSVKEIRAAAQSRLNALNFFVGMGELSEPVVPRVADPGDALLSRANIWGSTPRAKTATPEQVSAFVDDYFEALDEGRPDVLANSPEALQFQTNYGDAVTAEIVRRRGEEVGAVPAPKPEAEVEAGVAARAVAPEVKPLTEAEIDELVLRHPPSDEEFAALDNLINYYGGLSADALRKRAAKYGIEFDENDTVPRQNMFLVTELAYADWRNVRRNNLIAAQDTKVRTVPMPEAPEDMTPAVLRVLKGLQPGNITRAVERGERLNKLILGAKNIQDITKEDILEVVFADLNIEAKNKLLRSRDLEVFRNDVVQTVESRLAEVAKEVNSLRQRAVAASRLADAQGTSEADQKRRKSLEGIAQEYNRAADAFELALEQARTEGIQAMESALRALEPKALTGAPNVKGMVYFLNDSSAIIYALRSADATTGLHEVSHILRRKLNSSHQQVVEAWVNSRLPEMNGTNDRPLKTVSIDANGRLTGDAESVVMAEELFAEAFEQYLREGVTPNPKLATVFETIKMLFQKILAMINRSPEPVEISTEMYQLFDEIFGGVAEIRAEHLPNTGRYLNNKNLLLREGDERPLMRITPQGVVEETSVDRYRQFVTSLSDYRSRYPVLSRFGERAPGPGSSDIAAFSGPITRRTSIESRLDQSRVREAFLKVADFSAVATASMVEAMVYHLIGLGDDPVRSMRSIPPVMRSQLMGAAREIEEGINVISSVANDISRRVSPASKARAISDLARALEGLGVELQTGAQRGRRLVAPNLNSAEGIFDLIRNYVLVLDKDSLEALQASAEVELLRGMGVPVQLTNQRRPLTGFWAGLKSKAANFKEGDTYEAGLHVRDDIPMVEVPELEKASVAGDNVRIESTTQDMLQDVARALTGQQTGITPEAEPGLRRLAAVLLFYAGVVDIRRGNQPITANDLVRVSGKSRIHLMLEGVEDLNIEGMDISVDGVFRGLTRLPPDRRSLAAMTMGVYGALRNVNDDTRDLGLGIQAVDYRAYLRYISGLGASMSAADIGRAERVRKELGLQVNLAALETRLGKVYVPRSVRAQIVDDVVGQARRQLGLTDQKAAPPAVQYAIEHVMRNVLFGNTIVRQLYATAQQIDIFRGVASAGSFTAGLAAFLRTAPVSVLEMPLFSMGLIPLSPSRAAETLDVAGGRALTKWVRSLRRPSEEGDASVRAFKQGARDAAASLGDRFASAVTEFFSAAKYRVEVSPILEANPNMVLDINGVLYRAADLRRIFVRSGMYSNPFKMLAAANRAASRDFLTGTRVDSTTELSKDNADTLESAQNVVLDYLETNQGAAYRGARNAYSFAFEHGAEAMDAFSDYERTGAAVSFMELGISPGYAARLVVQGLYDYRGSMTAADRSFFRRVLMPFFAFRKNAMTHTINLLTSPRGVFMIRALERVPRMTAEAITAAFFETAVGPYGVDVSAMNPYQRDIYYSFRDYFEFGLGEDASDKELDKLREQLPEDQRDMPREELLRYSFNGWTALDGFGGYQNVPEDFKLAVRGLIANSSVVRGSNQIHIMNLALFSRDARRQFAEIGSAAVRPLPSQAGLPGYAAQRYPTIQMFLPTMTPNLIEAANRPRGVQASMYLSIPDSMVFSGMEQIVASMATVYVTSLAASHAAEGTFSKADIDAMLNAMEPTMDFRGIGGPVPKLVFDGILNLRGDETAYMELHPIMARMWENTYGMPPSYEGTADFEALQIDGLSTETNLMLNRLASLPTMGLFGTLMPMTGVEVDKTFKSTRLGKVVVREGRREIEYLDRPGEYLVPGEEGAVYRPFLVGMPAVIGKMVRFGEVNRLMLAAERAGSVQELAQIDEDLKNLLIGYGMEAATKAGFRVFDYDEVRTAASVQSQIPR